MKKLITFLGVLIVSLFVFKAEAQIIVNQSVSTGPYRVGDTITVTYTVDKGTTKPRYFWLRYSFNNKKYLYICIIFF